MPTLLKEEITFHSSSGSDWNGTLFEWNGELYRLIGPTYVPVFEKLLRDGLLHRLIAQELLVETEPTSLRVGDYPLVVKHRRLPFVSYPAEWTAGMIKDVALLLIDLELQLAQCGFSIHDTNPWNVLFDWTKPVFVDLGAIMPIEEDSIWPAGERNVCWPAYDQFCQLVLYPLYLMSWGYERIARSLLNDYKGITKSEFLKLSPMKHQVRTFLLQANRRLVSRMLPLARNTLPQPIRSALKSTFRSAKRLAAGPTGTCRVDFLHRCRQEVEAINIRTSGGDWPDYYRSFHGGDVPSLTTTDQWSVKNRNVSAILNHLRPTSVLDVGSNIGWYSQLAATLGSKVVALERDEVSAEHLYAQAKTQDLAILPLVMDFRSPTPGIGPCNKWLLPATQRLKCDMVLALALVHHLVSKQYLTFDQISQTLNSFSRRWTLVELIPPEDQYVRDWRTTNFAWYTTENLMSSLRTYFPRIEIFDSYPPPRKLLLCEKTTEHM